MKKMLSQASSAACLLLLVLITICCLNSAAVSGEEQAEDLKKLMASISQEKRPSAELVLSAYNEYVKLHEKLQLQLDQFEESGGKLTDPAADKTTREVRAILSQPEMQLISQNIFYCLRRDDESAQYERVMTPELANTIEQALNTFFG